MNLAHAVIISCLVLAQPADLELWVYTPTNLQVDDNVARLEGLWERAAAAGYRKVLLADSKFARLGDLPERYFRNVERAKRAAERLGLEIVPAVFPIGYSNDLLWHGPDLAEGLPVRDALFVVRGGEARPVADPPVAFGEKPDWKDDCVRIEGRTAEVRDNPGNARFVYRLRTAPYRAYHVRVEVRTEEFTGEPEIKALAEERSLQYASLGVRRSQDWREHHVVFNSLENEAVAVYFGVWGAARGRLLWRDWRIEEAGLVNVLRRDGAPCVVRGRVEGRDYEPIADPHLGNRPWPGEYEVWHKPPPIRTGLPDGTELRVSWYHPVVIYQGQVMCCLSEPRVLELLADQARRMHEAWGARGYMMSFDEIRTLNQDLSCRRRGLSPGAIVADVARKATALLDGRDAYVWSDMFDPHHNAVDGYYLVRGSLAGSWEGLPRRVIVVNWNFGGRRESLRFFAERGHRQVIAGYYDGDVGRVREWLEAARGVEGVIGVMYTTWRNRYDDLEAFARACREAMRR